MMAYELEIKRRVAASASILFNEGVRLSTLSDDTIAVACENCAAPKMVIGFIKMHSDSVKSMLMYIENYESITPNTGLNQLEIPFD
jgi:hypothetical protein